MKKKRTIVGSMTFKITLQLYPSVYHRPLLLPQTQNQKQNGAKQFKDSVDPSQKRHRSIGVV
eukprot:12858073-Ditylum_brightwellii.AAC.2